MLRKDIFQPCLVIYPESEWNRQMDELRARLNRWNREHQRIFRQFVSDAEMMTLDGNGRFLIPKRYTEMVGITQKVKFIGVGDSIELWSEENTGKPFITRRVRGCAGGNHGRHAERRDSGALTNRQHSPQQKEENKGSMATIIDTYHVPVLLHESVDGLNIKPGASTWT